MKVLILFSIFYYTFSSCSIENKEFDSTLSKFIACELPIELAKLEVGKQNLTVLTQEECIILHCFDSVRIYKTNYDYYSYMPNKWFYGNEYSYRTFCTFSINDQILGLIYERSYYPDNIFHETTEYVLATFTLSGKFISMLPIGGYYGDDIGFNGRISNEFQISIGIESYSIEKETKESVINKENKTYKITDEGKIEEI